MGFIRRVLEPTIDTVGGAEVFDSAPRELPAYIYEPLQAPNLTRFVQILPECDDESIRIELIVKDPVVLSKTRASFWALSYAWHEDNNQKVIIGNAQLPVSDDLYTALLHCRSLTSGAEHKPLFWIDKLSINQKTNEKEKTSQILLMPKLFPLASYVMFWLGDSDQSSNLAISHILQWSKTSRGSRSAVRKMQQPLIDLVTPETVHYNAGRTPLAPTLTSLRQFFSRRWFSRVWTFAEVCSIDGKRAGFQCGDDRLELADFCSAVMKMCRRFALDDIVDQNGFKVMRFINQIAIEVPQRRFSAYLDSALDLGVTERRDLLYAVRGLLPQHDELYPVWRPTEGFDQALAMLYTRHVFTQEKSLDLLLSVADADFLDEPAGLYPSWSIKLCQRLRKDKSGLISSLAGSEFCAARHTQALISSQQGDDSTQLRLSGMLLGNAVSVQRERLILARPQCPQRYEDNRGLIVDTCSDFAARHHLPETYQATREPVRVAVARTLSCDRFPFISSRLKSSYVSVLYGQYCQYSALMVERDAPREYQMPAVSEEVFKAAMKACWNLNDWHNVVRPSLQDVTMGIDHLRTISFVNTANTEFWFVKLSNGMFGRSATAVALGDTVAILPGFALPALLRPSCNGQAWRLVGVIYIHGAMLGEAFRKDRLEALCLI